MAEEEVIQLPTNPPKPRKVGGWADEGRERGRRKRDTTEEDERLRVPQEEEEEEDLPVIPDLEEVQEEELTTQIAAPPSLVVNRVATYKQLDSDLHKHAGLFTLNGDIDLKILAKGLSPESEITEGDREWGWTKLFAEVSPDIQSVWERRDRDRENREEEN